jgi:predicted DNA-binding transcriptional regulator AlpA
MRAPLDTFSTLPDEALVKLPTVAALYACSLASAQRWSKEGRIPAPQRIGKRAVGWSVGSLRKALKAGV